jgi:hypothetical protein
MFRPHLPLIENIRHERNQRIIRVEIWLYGFGKFFDIRRQFIGDGADLARLLMLVWRPGDLFPQSNEGH